MATPMETDTTLTLVERVWADDILPTLQEYITIPALSQAFDPDWDANGHIDRALALIARWCQERPVPGMQLEVHRLPGRSPLLLIEVPATPGCTTDESVVLYGHLDKQPEMTGWRDDLGPWKPVIEGDKLYWRGGADDGYAAFASLTALEAVHASGGEHARCIVLIEASEESGSIDLPAYVDELTDRIGNPGLVLCLDSGCADYERIWVTASLRGLVHLDLTVEILTEGVHSGDASGAVPSSFRIARQLLSRVEDEATGRILLPELHVDIPADRLREARDEAAVLRPGMTVPFPFVDGARPAVDDPVDQLLARTWQPTLSVTGADGLPPTAIAGNVLRPFTRLTLSFRLPPTCDADAAVAAISAALTTDPPYGARVTLGHVGAAAGWHAPSFAPWLWDSLQRASQLSFGQPAVAWGEGGSIPFMGMLGSTFPAAQFVVTGALGPGANAHGPNEFLHLPCARAVTATLALVLHDHATRP
jgi:acetylornithine deacetylase/succinyl-diaminopimelate desuccinylase-like protein